MPFFLITLITGATAAIAIAAVVDWFDKPADNLPDKMPDGDCFPSTLTSAKWGR